jgi:hypothetical protein
MRFAVILSLAGLLGIPVFSYGQHSTKADNPKVNQRDRSKAEPTADQQRQGNLEANRRQGHFFGGREESQHAWSGKGKRLRKHIQRPIVDIGDRCAAGAIPTALPH